MSPVIACYRPKPGMEAALLEEVRGHVPRLRREGFVTDFLPTVMRAKDGTLIEIFEWASEQAAAHAHNNPAIQEMWARFAEVCDNVPLASLPEAGELFASFEMVALD
jgi:quinol monooxygenase YgiN